MKVCMKTDRVQTGVNQRKDFEKEGAVAVPTYVVDSLGSFAMLAQKN